MVELNVARVVSLKPVMQDIIVILFVNADINVGLYLARLSANTPTFTVATLRNKNSVLN